MVLFVFSLCGLAASVSSRAMDPLVSAIARDFAVPVATAALVTSAYALPFAFSQPVLGPIGDLWGRAKLLKVCLWVLALALFSCALAPSFALLLAFRFLAGIAGGGIVPSTMAMIGDRFPPAARQVAISRVTAAGLSGQIISAGLAGILAATIGWRAGLVAAGTFALVAAVGITLVIRPTGPATPTRFRTADAVENYRKVFSNPKAILCFATVFLEGLALFGATPFVTELLERSGSGGPREAGFIIAAIGVGGVAYSAALSLIIRRARRRSLMAAGGLIASAGLAGLALELPWPVIAALFTLTGVGYMMLHNSIQTEVVELAPGARSSAYSVHAFSFFTGQALGPIVFAVGLHALGAGPILVIHIFVLGLTGVTVSRLFARHETRRAA